MAQAMLSAAYHICPTRDNFRLDSTFMYFIPALSILKLEQGRSPERIPDIHRTMLVLTVIALSVVVGLVSGLQCTKCIVVHVCVRYCHYFLIPLYMYSGVISCVCLLNMHDHTHTHTTGKL